MWRALGSPCTAAALVLSVSGAAPPTAQPPGVPAATVREGTLSFDGHATTGDFTGTTHTVTGAVHASAVHQSTTTVEGP